MANIVELPGGDTIEFPDDMSPDAMQAEIFKAYPEYAPKAPGLIDRVKSAWGAGANLKAPEGVTDATFDAGVPTVVDPKAISEPARSVGDVAGDIGVAALKGAVSLPESVVGLMDIPTGGRAGKALESIGYRPQEAKQFLDAMYSEPQQEANRRVRGATGFVDTLQTALENPSAIATTVGESLPSMLGGAGIARGVMSAAPKIAPFVAGAIGEGAIAAGGAAESIRGDTQDRLLTPKQSGAAIATGVLTGALGAAGGKLAQRMGFADIDTMLASGAANLSKKGFIRQIAESGLSEGVLEELPQSAQEQMWQNYATGKPLTDGVANAAAMGMLSGVAMGGAGGGYSAATQFRSTPQDILSAPTVDAAIQTAADSVDADLGKAADAVSGMLDQQRFNQAMEQPLPVAPDLTPGGYAPEANASPVSTEEAYAQREAQLAKEARSIEAARTDSAGVDFQVKSAEQSNAKQDAIDRAAGRNEQLPGPMQLAMEVAQAKKALDAAGITGVDRTNTIAAVRRGDLTAADVAESHQPKQTNQGGGQIAPTLSGEGSQNGANTADQTVPRVATPSAQSQGGELPGSAGIPPSAPTGNTGSIERRAEVAASGVRPAAPAGDSGASGVVGKFSEGQKYHQKLPEVTKVRVADLKRMNSFETNYVSDEVAEKMDFSEPIKASVFADGEMLIVDGHHRVAAARKRGIEFLPVEMQAINAKGERINALIADQKNATEPEQWSNIAPAENPVVKDSLTTAENPTVKDSSTVADVPQKAEKQDTFVEPVQKTSETVQVKPVSEERLQPTTNQVAKRDEISSNEPAIKTYPKAQAERMAKSFTGQGMPTEAYPHNGGYALRAPSGTKFSEPRESLAGVLQKIEQDGIKIDAFEKNGTISLSRIVVPGGDRGNGNGTAAMRSLIEYADRTGQRITLSPSADFGGNKSRLVKFYKQLGFIENKGRSRDFSTTDSMYREPAGNQDAKFRTRSEQLIADGDWDALAEQTFPDVAEESTETPAKAQSLPDAPVATDRTAATVQNALAAKIGSVPEITIHNGLKPAGILSRNTFKAINAVAKIFKQRVVYFSSDRPTADGFIHGGVIYLNVDASVSPLAVLGHELTHRLQQEQPEAWHAVAQVLAGRMDQGKLVAMYRSYHGGTMTDAQIIEQLQDEKALEDLMAEMVSDFAGNQFTDESFWSDVYTRVAENKPEGVAKRIIERLRLAVMKMVGLLGKAIRQPGFNAAWLAGEQGSKSADAWAGEVSNALKSAYAQWIERINAEGYDSIQSSAPKFSEQRSNTSPSQDEIDEYASAVEGGRKREALRILHRAAGIEDIDQSFERGESMHAPAGPEDGSPLYDVSKNGTYPEDVYSHNGLRYYSTGEDKMDAEAYRLIKQSDGRPNMPIRIYRSVEKDGAGKILPGDWVTTVRQYAKDHGDANISGEHKVISKLVYARDVFTAGDSWLEWGYHPQEFKPKFPRGDRKNIPLDERVASIQGAKFSPQRETVNIDGVERPTTNSNGKPIAQTEEGLRNFWKWFKDSAVVDSDGKPLVVYHGTNANDSGDAFSSFDTYASNYGLMGMGGYFTADSDVANSYTKKGKGNSPSVYPVYLSIKNPLDMDQAADVGLWTRQFENIDDFHDEGNTNESWYRAAEDSLANDNIPKYEGAEIMQDGLRAMGFDGITHIGGGRVKTDGVKHRVYVAFEPEQIKSAISNEQFDASNPDIRYSPQRTRPADQENKGERFSTPRSAITGQNINQAWANPDNLGKWDNVVRTIQDKLIDTKRIVAEIRKAGIAVKDAFDPYLQEILYHGRAASRVHEFAESELKPLLVEMSLRGIQTPEARQAFEDYLWVRHATERNAHIAKANPKMPDGGSGLTNQQAADILAGQTVKVGGRDIKLDLAKMSAYQSLAKRVDAITKETTDTLVRYGLETQETVDTWRQTYSHYVPLMRDMEADDNYSGALGLGQGTGQGFSVRGSAAKRAMGSERGVIDILANVAMQRERAIVRGEKNRVAQSLYGLTLTAPNPDFWITINPDSGKNPQAVIAELVTMGINPIDAANIANEPKQQYVDPRTGMVAERVNPQLRNRDDVMAVRINGKDRYVMFSSDERAQQMVRNLKNLDAEQLGFAMQNVAVATRWFASINTQYNPVFGLTNGVRDLGSAALNLSSTELKNDRAAVLSGAFSALRGIYADLRDHRAGRAPTSQWALLFEEFAKEGGQTGYRDMFQTSAARSEALASELKNAGKGQRWAAWGEKNSHLFGWLSDYNTSIENAVRLSAYKVAIDKGMSKQQAAALAKNLTVNFNKKGLAATQAGALFAFFNAAVQGTARIGQTMVRIENGKPSLTSAGKAILYGGMMAGALQAVMFSLAGYDDDEPPQFQREKNFIIPLPDGKFLSIPYPLGYHVIPGIGRIGTEFALSGFRKPGKRLTDLASMIMDGFNPIGGTGGGLTQMLSPTVVDPIVALSENKDWTGKAIYREDFNKMHPTAGWTRKKDSSSDFSRNLAYGINYVTGGGKYEIGLLSPTPDQLDYLVGQATGGVGRETLKAYQFTKNEITGEDIPIYKVPVVGRFVGETTGKSSEMSKFYGNLRRIGEHKSALDEMQHSNDSNSRTRYLIDHPDARMVKAADEAQRDISQMNKRKRELMEKDASRESIKLIEMQITARVKRYNEQLGERQPGV